MLSGDASAMLDTGPADPCSSADIPGHIPREAATDASPIAFQRGDPGRTHSGGVRGDPSTSLSNETTTLRMRLAMRISPAISRGPRGLARFG
jgi:hypothetical protein